MTDYRDMHPRDPRRAQARREHFRARHRANLEREHGRVDWRSIGGLESQVQPEHTQAAEAGQDDPNRWTQRGRNAKVEGAE